MQPFGALPRKERALPLQQNRGLQARARRGRDSRGLESSQDSPPSGMPTAIERFPPRPSRRRQSRSTAVHPTKPHASSAPARQRSATRVETRLASGQSLDQGQRQETDIEPRDSKPNR